MNLRSALGKSFFAFMAASMLLSPAALAAPKDFSPSSDGNFYYRYRGGDDLLKPTNPFDSKDIVAWYIGGVGYQFSELLPIKPQWQGLTWKVVKGALPDGISFDNKTRMFSGTPTREQLDHVVEMVGYTSEGVEEATAQINFEIVDMLGQGRQVTLYAHTGKYKYDELAIPAGVTVNSWTADPVMSLPPGITVDGPYFQGIPTKAGRYPILIRGMDYLGEVVLTYIVTYVVEDGPSFPIIPDDIRTLAPSGQPGWVWSGYFNFGAPSTYAVNYAIDPAKDVRYFLRIAEDNASLPGSVKSNSNPLNLKLIGFATQPYDTVKAYFHAIDSDGTSGDSNVFEFGTGDPTPECRQYPYAPEFVSFVTGKQIKTQLALPFGNQGTVKYTLTSGSLPEGLTLEDGGRIVGVTRNKQPRTPITVHIEVINDQATLTADCNYEIQVVNQKLKLYDSTAPQNQHGRVGAPYSGSVSVSGSIPDFSVDWTSGAAHPSLEAAVPAENQTTVPVTGRFDKAELPASYSFTVVNGDTNTATGDLDLYGYGPLSFGDKRTFVPNFTVKRLDYGNWGAVPFDATTVVPDTSGAKSMPIMALGGSFLLPDGVVFDGRKFGGMTKNASGQYGPFRVTMSDYTGESIESEMFYVNVEARAANVITSAPDQVFVVEQSSSQNGAQPDVQHPAGALGFKRTWKLDGPALPAWAHFDASTGVITADAGIPFGDLAQPANQTVYGPYTLTVSDDDPLEPSTSEPSRPFNIVLTDMPAPSAGATAPVRGTVSGDAGNGFRKLLKSIAGVQDPQQKTVTTISAGGFNSRIDPKSIVGTVDQVVFTHSEPASPAGVPLQISLDGHSAWFDGSPTESFVGTAKVFFKDIRGRVGHVPVPMEVRPYPTVSMTAASYDLPRLAPAGDYGIKPTQCTDCWSSPKWYLDATSALLPPGLTVSEKDGLVIGFTEELDDETPGTRSPFSGIILKAVSKGANGEELVSWTEPFQIDIKPRVPMTLQFPSGRDVWYLNDRTSFTSYSFNTRDISLPKVGGSHRPEVTYGSDLAGLLPSQGLNSKSGVFTWDLNSLTLGSWSTSVTATDAEGQEATSKLDVKATLFGDVGFVSGGGSLKLRRSESFMTGNPLASSRHAAPIVVDNFVGAMTYSKSGGPDTVRLLPSGEFLEGSRFDNDGIHTIVLDGKDSDGRKIGIGSIPFTFEVVPPLVFQAGSATPVAARQYSVDEPISTAFPAVDNVLDTLEYEVTAADGGPVPGTIVYKVYDADGSFAHWQWADGNGSGSIVPSTDPAWKSKLPLDALVFDPAHRTLKGIPSKAGTFNLRLTARDTYRNSYIHQDDVNYPAEKRTENNTATSDIVVEVAPAFPLQIVNRVGGTDASTEELAQYTRAATLRGVVSNAAYGLPLSWSPASGAAPKGVAPAPLSVDLAFGGYAEGKGTFPGITFKGTDRAGREITNQPVTFVVGDRETFELVATANPKKMAVFLTDADLTVMPRNHAFGRNIGKVNWSVSGQGNIPPGVSMSVDDRGVRFSGKSPKVGTYGPVTVSAVDALGARASIAMTFEVRIPDGAIILNVADIKAKQTYPFQMQATSFNTYGTVRYYSYGLTGTYGANMTLDEATGFIQGKFDEPQRFSIDTYVTDETNRVTSKPVSVEVLPFVRVTVPTTVKATETLAMTQEVTTDYALGALTYEKGRGVWPDGLSVDPLNGTISGKTVKSEPGTYKGLTIRVTDTFKDHNGRTYMDVQDSNVFEIALDGMPDVADVSSTASNRLMLYTKDIPAKAWKPTVIDKITKKTWDLPGTVYSINKDIAFDTGLTFDSTTGEISGTPTKLIVYTDMTLTVTSPHGNTDTTKPFWFAVQPQGSIWARAGQTDLYRNRVGTLLTTQAPIFDNTVGEVTYTATGVPSGMKLDPETGVVAGTPTAVAVSTIVITAKDGASRTATFTYKIDNRGVLSFTLAKPTVGVNIGQNYTALNLPVTANIGGKATYTANGLPDGLSLNPANGALTGSPSASIPNNTQYPVTVRVDDDFDGSWRQIDYTLTVALPILPAAGQRTVYNLRIGDAFAADAPVFTNAVGAVAFTVNAPPAGLNGLSVNPETGVVSGTPIFVAHGTYPNHTPVGEISIRTWNAAITITDSTGRFGSLSYVVNARRPLTLTLASPTTGLDMGRAYSNLNRPAAGQVGGTMSFTATGLPEGLTVNTATGALDGTVPAGRYQPGDTFPVVVKGVDSFDGSEREVSYTLAVADPITVTAGQTTLYAVRVGDTLTVDLPRFENAYGSVTYAVSGKPAWMSFDTSNGASTGTATTVTTGNVTVTIRDSINRTQTFVYAIQSRGVLGLSLTPSVDGVDFGKVYTNINRPSIANLAGTATFTDVGGVIGGSGLTVNTSTGAISGTLGSALAHGDKINAVVRLSDSYDTIRLQLAASGNVAIPASDTNPGYREVSYTMTAARPITVVPGQTEEYSLRVGDRLTVDVPKFADTIGDVTYTQSGKPSWLTFSDVDGGATGVATQVSTGNVTVTVRDATMRTATFTYRVSSKDVLAMSLSQPVRGVDFDKVYPSTTNRPTTSGIGGTASFEDVGGAIGSTGLLFNTSTGAFSGQISQSMTHGQAVAAKVRLKDTFDILRMQLAARGNVSIPAGDATPDFREISYDLIAARPLEAMPGQKTAYVARVGDRLSTDPILIDNLIGKASFSAPGLASYLSIDPATGVVSGPVNSAVNWTLGITVTDESMRTSVFSYGVATKAKLAISISSLVTDVWQSVGQTYDKINRPTVTNVGGTATYVVTGLPAEFSFDPATGSISGAIARGTYPEGTTFPIRTTVTDSFDGGSVSIDYALVLRNAPAPTISVAPAATGYSVATAATLPLTVAHAKDGDVVGLAPGSQPLPPGFSITKNSAGAWVLARPASTDSDIGVYRGINLRITDTDGAYGETGPFDLILRTAEFLNFAGQTVEARADVPLGIAPPVPSAGKAMAQTRFSFATDTTGGSVAIDAATGAISGTFNRNGTNVVKVVELYDGKQIREFNYNVVLKVVQLSVTMPNFAVVSGQPSSTAVNVAYGHPTARFRMSGSVPAGLSIDAGTGVIGGTAITPGIYDANVVYEDDYALVTLPVRITVLGDSSIGHRYWRAHVTSSNPTSGYTAGALYELEMFDAGNNNVTKLASRPGAVFDGNYATSVSVTRNANILFDLDFGTKVQMSKAVATARSTRSGTTSLDLYLTYYWSNDGLSWTKAGGAVLVPYVGNSPTTVTTALTN